MASATTPSAAARPAALATGTDADPRVVLIGLVTDAEGHPVSSSWNLYVAVTDAGGSRAGSKLEDGRYSFAGLAPGEWNLSCRSTGFRDFDRQLVLDPSKPLHREDFVMERAWNIAIEVRTPEGKGAVVWGEASPAVELLLGAVATKEPPGDRLPPTELTQFTEFGVGRFASRFPQADPALAELSAEAIGRLAVDAAPPIYVSLVSRHFVIETKTVDSPIESLTFTVAPERLDEMLSELVVSAVDAKSGQPVEGASGMLRTSQSAHHGFKPGLDGLIRFEHLAPGQYAVSIRANGYATETRLLELEPGRGSEPEMFLLSPPHAVTGRIVDADGRPVAARPSLHPYFEGDPVKSLAHTLSNNFRADAEGRFAAKSLPPGRYLLILEAERRDPPASNEPEWTRAPLLVDTTSGPAEDLEIVLVRGTELTLKPTSKEVVGMSFHISTTDGLPYRQGRLYEASPRTELIAPGTYELLLSRGSTEIRRVRISVGAGGSTVDVAP